MRPRLRIWTLLLLAAIGLVGVMFWIRAHPEHYSQKDPLTESQEVISGALGMTLQKDSEGRGGLEVLEVSRDGAAARAGIQVGDRIIAVVDRSVWHIHQFQELVLEQLGQFPALILLKERDGSYQTVALSQGIDPEPLLKAEEEHSHGHSH
ncbi:MAG: PDZ domain-containing protein [Armatimonadetes bacterium]|nr:PDZ domain-containing protein [Armatimonadota bacterium]